MSYVVNAIYQVLVHVPGLAARTHLPCGRMGQQLRCIMCVAGAVLAAAGAMCAFGMVAGFSDGNFGYFPAGAIALVAVFLLLGGTNAIVRAVKNPAPRVASNVIPFRHPVEYAARDLHRYRRWESRSET